MSLRAGVATCEITIHAPDDTIRDPLYAKALVLDDGTTRAAIVTMDTTAIGGRDISRGYLPDVSDDFLPQLRGRVQAELDIPGGHVLVNASHTHPPGPLLCNDDQQLDRVFEIIRRAASDMTAVRMGAGSGREDRITINRGLQLRNGQTWTIRHANPCPPDDEVVAVGPIDPEIGVLRIDRLDGRPLAVVYNFACHLLFGDARGAITANFPGVASKLIEQTLGHGTVALFLQGAAGDVVDVLFKDFARPRDIEPLGVMLGLSTLQAWRSIATADVTLGVLSETIALPRRTDIPEQISQLQQEQEALLESLRGTTLNFRSFLPLYLQHKLHPEHPSDYSYRYLQEQALNQDSRIAMDAFTGRLVDKYLKNVLAMERLVVIREDLDTLRKHQQINADSASPTVAAEVQGIRIGDSVVITSPAELLVEVGLNLKQASPYEHTLVAPFSNGYLHYGIPAGAYGRGGYESMECLLAPQWQDIYQRAAIDIMHRLHTR